MSIADIRNNGLNPLSYLGVQSYSPVPLVVKSISPTPNDSQNFTLGSMWLNKVTEQLWVLVNLNQGVATWVLIEGGAGVVLTLTGNSGGPVPATLGNINTIVIANTGTPTIVGNPGTSTLSLSFSNLVSGNTAIGTNSLLAPGVGSVDNTAYGIETLMDITTGEDNNAYGAAALSALTTGSRNIAIGNNAGLNYTTESDNILIGFGVEGTATETNTLRIGASTGTGNGQLHAAFISGIDGVNVGPSSVNVVTEHSDQLGTAVITAGSGITVTGGTNTITISAVNSGTVTGLHTQDGNTVTPTAGVINISGAGVVSTTGTAGPNTVTINVSGAVASSFPTDSGTATPSAGALTIHGGTGVTTSGAGSTVTITATGTNPAATCSFLAYNNADAASFFADGIFKTLPYPAIVFDLGTNFNTGTYTFTAPATGYYCFQCAVSLYGLTDNTLTEYSMQLVTTGGSYLLSNGNPYAMSDPVNHSMGVNQTQYIAMTSGDTAVVQVLVHNGASTGTAGVSGKGGSLGAQYRTIFSGFRVA